MNGQVTRQQYNGRCVFSRTLKTNFIYLSILNILSEITEISKTKFKLPRVVPCENEFEFQANACLYLTRKRKGVHKVDHMALLKLLW